MKDGAVVPHIVSRGLQFDLSDIGDEPMDMLRGCPQSFPVRVDGGLRNIEDGDALVSAGEKVIDQCGFTTADINDGRRASRSRLFYECKEISRCGRYQLTASGAFPP